MDNKERSKQHFDEIATDYNNSSDGRFVKGMYESLINEINQTQGSKILDVGCGNGNLFKMLPDNENELFGVDFSGNMISEAEKECGDKASFAVADAEKLPFEDNYFDVVVCNASFHHYIHPNKVLSEMYRVLKKGGRLLIGDPYSPSILRPIVNFLLRFSSSGDYHIYGVAEMQRLLRKNGLNPTYSVKTGTNSILHMAGK